MAWNLLIHTFLILSITQVTSLPDAHRHTDCKSIERPIIFWEKAWILLFHTFLFLSVCLFLSLFYIAFYLQDIAMLKSQVFTMLIVIQIVNQVQIYLRTCHFMGNGIDSISYLSVSVCLSLSLFYIASYLQDIAMLKSQVFTQSLSRL
jgi:uncharacterized MAPEG superfamily protein